MLWLSFLEASEALGESVRAVGKLAVQTLLAALPLWLHGGPTLLNNNDDTGNLKCKGP